MTAPVRQGAWHEADTTPEAIDAALRDMLRSRHSENESYVPARVLNLVAILDRAYRGEIVNRLERVDRFHPSRTIICAVEDGRVSLDAWATLDSDVEPEPGMLAVGRERVEITVGPEHLAHLDRIVAPVLVRDLPTIVWAPHGHAEALDALLDDAGVVLIDSDDAAAGSDALQRAAELSRRAYVVDLAWLRGTPWRERVAAAFDPADMRVTLRELDDVTVHPRRDSLCSGLLFLGWLASRLGWEPARLTETEGALSGRATKEKGQVCLALRPLTVEQPAPGLGGVTLETAAGFHMALGRGPGGLGMTRRLRGGAESSWQILGASRGEGGILGEGIRQALLRDPTYRPALEAARALRPL